MAVEDKETLVSELAKKLRAAEDFLTETEDYQRLPPESLSGYRRHLIALQCKHIPAEICSAGKLIERIEEVDSLVGDLKGELERQ